MRCKKIMVYYIYDCMNTGNSSMVSSDTNSNNYPSEETLVQKYTHALHKYYQLKTRYENDISTKKNAIKKATKSNRERRDLFRKFTPFCVSCGRKVGSIFRTTSTTNDTTHIAKCGDTQNPCQLDIKLKTDTTINILKERADDLETLHTYGKNVIRLTNDGMFGYLTGDAVVDTHDIYEQDRIAKEAVQKQRDLVINSREDANDTELWYTKISTIDNKDKQLYIHTKMGLFNEHVASIKTNMNDYTRTGNKQFIRDGMQLYTNEMRDNIDALYKAKYARMAVERRDKPTTYILFQEVTTLASWLIDDLDPQVVRFAVGKKLKTPEKREQEAELVPSSIPDIATATADADAATATEPSNALTEHHPDIDLSPMDTSLLVGADTLEQNTELDVSDDDVSDAESDEDDGEPLPRIQIGETVDTSSDDSFVPPPPPISDLELMELSSSDEGFVQPPPPIEELEDSSSEGYVPPPPPPMEETGRQSEA